MKMKMKPKTKQRPADSEEAETKTEKLELNGRVTKDEADRITYHLGRKMSDGDYGNTTIGLTYSSSVGPKETVDDATSRVIKYVEKNLEEKILELTSE